MKDGKRINRRRGLPEHQFRGKSNIILIFSDFKIEKAGGIRLSLLLKINAGANQVQWVSANSLFFVEKDGSGNSAFLAEQSLHTPYKFRE
ncbi:hypothetical protein SAMN05660226_01100 [Parapedobacter luteus]|uniref:Uncharacterized protein n=1 Tax=Parapedobacter luteus TaxID=623280 RepID=A0A1T5AWU4_9SPHI|nr:hypothetical protein SAMN05660226_01100 [Parapedobacter luteus]